MKNIPKGPSKPPDPDVTKALTKSPVLRLYSRTSLLPALDTNKLPLGPNFISSGPSKPPEPDETSTSIKSPVLSTSSVNKLATKRVLFGPKARAVGQSSPPDPEGIIILINPAKPPS